MVVLILSFILNLNVIFMHDEILIRMFINKGRQSAFPMEMNFRDNK